MAIHTQFSGDQGIVSNKREVKDTRDIQLMSKRQKKTNKKYKIAQYRNLKTEQHEPHKKTGMISGATER